MQSKNSKCSCGSGKNYKNCCMPIGSAEPNQARVQETIDTKKIIKIFMEHKQKGMPILYNYQLSKQYPSPAFEYMPDFEGDLERDLSAYLTMKVFSFKVWDIFWGKTIDTITKKLIEQDFRQYEFNLDAKKGAELLLLIIKEKEKFFTHQQPFYYLHDKQWQVIPIKYSTLKGMTDAERSIIYWDFD